MGAQLLINLDVPDLQAATAFYTQALGLTIGRQLGPGIQELTGACTPVYLLEKPAESPPDVGRSYQRHWTPVHLDWVVSDLDAALATALAAGAKLERGPDTAVWGGAWPSAAIPLGMAFACCNSSIAAMRSWSARPEAGCQETHGTATIRGMETTLVPLILSQAQVEKIAKALADEHRLQILREIHRREQLVCGDLQTTCELSQPTISHHVKILAEAGLITSEKNGRCLRLTVNNDVMKAFTAQLQNWFV